MLPPQETDDIEKEIVREMNVITWLFIEPVRTTQYLLNGISYCKHGQFIGKQDQGYTQ
jgi:hypothetical protein